MRAFSVQHLPLSRPKRGNEEYRLHADLVAFLNIAAKPSWLWFHVPGNPRSAADGARLKAMGMMKGAPDLLFIAPARQPLVSRCFALELKAGPGRQTDEQKHFALRLDSVGGRYELARSMDEAISILRGWGALRLSEEKAA